MSRLALAVPHTSWAAGRPESLAKLLSDLGLGDTRPGISKATVPSFGEIDVFVHDNRSTRDVWSEKIWTWGISTGADVFLQLQDDMRVAPEGLFWDALAAMLDGRHEDVLNLQAVHPLTPALLEEKIRGYTVCDGLPGPAYAIHMPALVEMIAWRKESLGDGAVQAITEDTLLGIFCMATRRPIWSPIPTIVDHPGEVKSTYGNDEAIRQRPLVRWDNWVPPDRLGMVVEALVDPRFWSEEARHLGRFYTVPIPELAHRYVKDYTESDMRRDLLDRGSHEVRRLYYARLARTQGKPKTRILFTTPVRDGFSPGYMESILETFDAMRDIELIPLAQHSVEPSPVHYQSEDLVITRSRLLRYATYESDCTHMLFIDADTSWNIRALLGMLACGYDFVQAPYPRRDGRGYSIRWLESTRQKGGPTVEDIHENCLEIESTGLGFTLLSRRCMEKMLAHYENEPDPEEQFEKLIRGNMSRREMVKAAYELGRDHGHRLTFDDIPKWDPEARPRKTAAVFQLVLGKYAGTPFTVLSGEDSSFCQRWRMLGEKVWLYIGMGSPVSHWGQKLWEGTISEVTGGRLSRQDKPVPSNGKQ
jgi:hypothetical protein